MEQHFSSAETLPPIIGKNPDESAVPSHWDTYQTSKGHITVLEGSWKFNERMCLLLNGTILKNGEPLSEPALVEGTIRAFWDTPSRLGYFLKAEEGKRSSEISLE